MHDLIDYLKHKPSSLQIIAEIDKELFHDVLQVELFHGGAEKGIMIYLISKQETYIT